MAGSIEDYKLALNNVTSFRLSVASMHMTTWVACKGVDTVQKLQKKKNTLGHLAPHLYLYLLPRPLAAIGYFKEAYKKQNFKIAIYEITVKHLLKYTAIKLIMGHQQHAHLHPQGGNSQCEGPLKELCLH